MKCPYCGSTNYIRKDSRDTTDGKVFRRNECKKCHRRFNSMEVYIPDGDRLRDHVRDFMRKKGTVIYHPEIRPQAFIKGR